MIREIDSKALMEMMGPKKSFVLIDCREQEEWDEAHIEKALFMPLSTFKNEVQKAESGQSFHKDSEVIIYCRSGKRSMMACEYLQDLGYTNLTNVTDGILGWIAAGFKVEVSQ